MGRARKQAAVLLLWLLASLSTPTLGLRLLQEQQSWATVSSTSELPNGLDRAPPNALNASLPVYLSEIYLRFYGRRFVPFQLTDQQTIISALKQTIVPTLGPVWIVTYREVVTDEADPGLAGMPPAVDVALKAYFIFNSSYYYKDNSAQWRVVPEFSYMAVTSDIQKNYINFMKLLFGLQAVLPDHGNLDLLPVTILDTNLSVIAEGAPGLSAEQASAVALPLEEALLEKHFGTLVEVVSKEAGAGQPKLLQLEVTMNVCPGMASTLDCEQQRLAAVIDKLAKSEEALRQWREAGIRSVELAGVRERKPPEPVSSAKTATPGQPWVPWYLDRIDQRSLPLDGKFAANATGTGVTVYIVSSGIRGDHIEFGYMDGKPGTRAQPAWGFGGLDPLSDCPDASLTGYGMGTLAASLCCGLQLGAAKNATVRSVRFRALCSADPIAFADGGLTAAIDLVLSVYQPPAVVLIDAWFNPKRLIAGDINNTAKAITQRLDKLAQANLTAVAGATSNAPCENIIASHPGVIAVAPSGIHDEASGTRNASCVDIWAPSGGPGVGLTAASSEGPNNFTNTIPRWFGAAAVVVGTVAQYLQMHPHAPPREVRQAVVKKWSTKNGVLSISSPTALLYTNASLGTPVEMTSPTGTGSDSLGTGATVGIAVAASFGAIAAVAVILFLFNKKRGSKGSGQGMQELYKPGWELGQDEIEICLRSDGSKWLLGEGRYGKVYKGVARGVQAVSVRELPMHEEGKAVLLQKMDLLKDLSRDANICQFYGASIVALEPVKLVFELMEGGNLRHALSHEERWQLHYYKRGRETMLDIVRAVVFLHDRGFAHQAIQSKNILLSRGLQGKLGDVGLSQLFSTAEQGSWDAAALPWAGPEVVSGGPGTVQADMAKDVFSLGVVLWELATLEVPQLGGLRAPEVPRECPQHVADIISACTQQGPALRPTARELYALLLAYPPANGDFGLTVHMDRKASSSSSGILQTPKSLSQAYSGQSSLSTWGPGGESVAIIDISKIEFCTDAEGHREKLGEGAYGSVYKVLLDGAQHLAAKVLELGNEPGVQQSFVREASNMWRLRHRNIVSLNGIAFDQEGHGLLLMELMEGGPLYKALNVATTGSRIFGWYERGKDAACDVASGLHYLHSMKMTHFDLKASNVLISRELTAKLADVGLTRVMTSTHHSVGKDGGDVMPGTFAYMAPELLVGTKCTQAVDIYSFGILLWEICTGCQPVRGRMSSLQVPQDCPQAVADLYEECTAADPAARPTARQLVQRLRQLRELPREGRLLQQQGAGVGAGPCVAGSSAPTQLGGNGGTAPPQVQERLGTEVAVLPVGAQMVSPFAAMRPSFLMLTGPQTGGPCREGCHAA